MSCVYIHICIYTYVCVYKFVQHTRMSAYLRTDACLTWRIYMGAGPEGGDDTPQHSRGPRAKRVCEHQGSPSRSRFLNDDVSCVYDDVTCVLADQGLLTPLNPRPRSRSKNPEIPLSTIYPLATVNPLVTVYPLSTVDPLAALYPLAAV